MSSRYEIRLSGSGGQGIILMGIILAEAIGIYDGEYVAHFKFQISDLLSLTICN